MTPRIIFPLLMLLAAFAAHADDWPGFRGPTGQGHSSEGQLPLEWDEERNVVWRIPVPGQGWSSPVVSEGRIWLTTAIVDQGAASLRAIAFDFETGSEVVNSEIFRMNDARLLNLKNSHASPTPVLEGDHVYVHFGAAGTGSTHDGR